MLRKNLFELLGKKRNRDSQGNLSRGAWTPLFVPNFGRWYQRPISQAEKSKFWSWLSGHGSAGKAGEGSEVSSGKDQTTAGRSD